MNGLHASDALPTDAEALARLLTDAYLGQWIYTSDQMAERIGTPKRDRFTLSVGDGTEVVAGLNAEPFVAAPGGLRVQVYGDPAAFTPLYLEALTRAHRLGYRQLLSVVRQDHRPQVEFLGAAGFRNAYQSWGAHLDLTGFDFAPFQKLEEKHYLEGTEVHQYAPDSPGAPWDALHHLYAESLKDTPRNPTTTHDSDSPEYFQEEIAAGRVFAAVRRGEMLSYAALGLEPGSVSSEHTATRAGHRNRGLATLVKATALNWARSAGYARASTGGNVANLPMLRVNQALGYLPEPMWLTWVQGVPTSGLPDPLPDAAATSPA
ncbi:GNAT family N-acetyltransferase [Deinococcus sp. UYEF24]